MTPQQFTKGSQGSLLKKKKKKKKTQNHTKNNKNCRMIIVGTRFEAQTQNVKGYWPSEPRTINL